MKNFITTKRITFVLILSLILIPSVACTKTETPSSEPSTIAVDEPNPSTPDLSSKEENSASETSLKMSADSAESSQDIQQITLKDLEGNIIKDDFSDDEIQAIVQAFHDSSIMDTPYIEMINGYTMDISLKDNHSVFIHSYGDPSYIIARNDQGETYHLACEFIGNILLDN